LCGGLVHSKARHLCFCILRLWLGSRTFLQKVRMFLCFSFWPMCLWTRPKDRLRWRLMAAAALDGGHTTTSQCSKRVAQQEDKRATQREAMQQPAHLPLHRHYDMRHCHLLHCHAATCIGACHAMGIRGLVPPCHFGNRRHCLPPRHFGDT
jgi:hypothetical protein